MQIQKPKGTYDLTPAKAFQRTYLENSIRNIFDRFNYKEIRTPTFEQTKLFQRSIGEETDIVSKEMYSFNEGEFTLKPEMTAPVIRSYVENRLYNENPLQKLYYISNMFRRERPQAGRFREFSQFGAECIGSSDFTSDAEMIVLADTILKELGLSDYSIRINTIGSTEERKLFTESLRNYLKPNFDSLSSESKRRFEKNPLRILDTKDAGDLEILKAAPALSDYLNQETLDHFNKLLGLLDSLGVNTVKDPRLVRGFDYYTSTTFEFTSDSLGAQNSLLGGGRYDLLAGQLGAKDTPAIGFAAGFERLEMALASASVNPKEAADIVLFICSADETVRKEVMKMISDIRKAGIKCETDLIGRSVKSQMKEADRQKARYTMVIGERELQNDSAEIRRMKDGNIRNVSGLANIINYLKDENQAGQAR